MLYYSAHKKHCNKSHTSIAAIPETPNSLKWMLYFMLMCIDNNITSNSTILILSLIL